MAEGTSSRYFDPRNSVTLTPELPLWREETAAQTVTVPVPVPVPATLPVTSGLRGTTEAELPRVSQLSLP